MATAIRRTRTSVEKQIQTQIIRRHAYVDDNLIQLEVNQDVASPSPLNCELKLVTRRSVHDLDKSSFLPPVTTSYAPPRHKSLDDMPTLTIT